jgi:short-subunit dehydrogenase
MKKLQGKTALITGASRGIGTFIAQALAKEEMNLILVARTLDSLEKVAAELCLQQTSVKCISTDIGQRDQLVTLVERAEAEFNGVDVLVNNAGFDLIYPYDKLGTEIINQIIEVNLAAPMILSRLFLPKMIERGRGHIVNISSLSGLVGTPYDETYAATKHGLMGFTRSLRLTAIGESYPIGVSVICPGFISETGMYNTTSKESGLHAPAIFGTSPPENVAKAVVSAIIKDKAEVIVNSKPFRPLLLLQALFPSIAPLFALKTGAVELFKGFAQYKMKDIIQKS